jgi:hypothetical protein
LWLSSYSALAAAWSVLPAVGPGDTDIARLIDQLGNDDYKAREAATKALDGGELLSGGSRTWSGARAQAILMSVWRTCWQQGRSALGSLSQLLRGVSVALTLLP